MAQETKIGWANATWSPWRGCVKVSDGCANCYADKQSKRNPQVMGVWGADGVRVVNADWEAPKRWARKAAEDGRRLVLFPSLCDPLEDWPGLMFDTLGGLAIDAIDERRTKALSMPDIRHQFWELVDQTKAGAVWTVLTKRPENAIRFWNELARPAWLIATTENQKWFNRRAWFLAKAAHLYAGTGLSIEPQLGPIKLKSVCVDCETFHADLRATCRQCQRPTWRPGWVIIGGESGARSSIRPWFVQWGLDLVAQCQAAGIPVFFKQLGSFALYEWDPDEDPRSMLTAWAVHKGRGIPSDRVGLWRVNEDGLGRARVTPNPAGKHYKRLAIELAPNHPKGEDPDEWPNRLAVQQFPEWGTA